MYLAELMKKEAISGRCSEHGIIAHRTPPYTPQHNGMSERRNQTLIDMVRSMMIQTTLPKSFWDYALETTARILNMVPSKKVDKTPYEIWHGQAPKLPYLKVCGCETLVKHDTLTKPDKLDPSSFRCIFVGYPNETMGYSFYSPFKNKVFVSWNAEFFENDLIDLKASGKSFRTRRASDCMCLYIDAEKHELGDFGEPTNYKAALLDPESKQWLDAMNQVALTEKTDMDGVVYVFKACLVAKGFTQTYRVDYEETFSHVADIRAIRILIAIAVYYNYKIWQMDIKTSFLNGHLSEEVYMEQPEDFVNPKYPNYKFDFTQNPDEPCVYQKASGSYVAILILYVDDILLMGNNIPMLQDVKPYLGRSFSMKDLGDAAYILGIKIYCDRFRMDISKRGNILMQEIFDLNKTQCASTREEVKRMQNVPYASAVGSKIRLTAMSATEAEYIAPSEAAMEVVWIRKFISWLGIVPTINEPIKMLCDNSTALLIANEPRV
nr:hypothetical protein [Tanacetum cinerariifolium]